MEKFEDEKQNQLSRAKSSVNMWDCGSSLYDSFELNSFKRQLDSAIANSSRTLSMPHLPDRRVPLQPPPPQPQPQPQPHKSAMTSKKSFKISRSLHKFLRSVFKPNNSKSTISSSSSSPFFHTPEKSKDRFYVVYDKSGPVLSTIPEVPEFEISGLSPEITSLVRRSASERFTATSMGISCA